MTDQQISALINTLRLTNTITPLQKDILDTWDTLHKDHFDEESAQKQIISNNVNYPDIFVAIRISPGVVQKPFNEVTQNDMIFNLHRQLEGLLAKELEVHANGKKEG